MRHRIYVRNSGLIVAAAAILLLAGVAAAQTGDGYDLTWSTVDGGGATFPSGGVYSLGSTVGQPDAGLLTGSEYALDGGFWGDGALAWVAYEVYLPLVMRSVP
jgi:hypothetical protein